MEIQQINNILMKIQQINNILKKYDLVIDEKLVSEVIDEVIDSFSFYAKLYNELSSTSAVHLVPRVYSLQSTNNYQDFYLDSNFTYYLENNHSVKYSREKLQSFYAILVFLNNSFFIDDKWDLNKAKLLKQMVADKEIGQMTLTILNKTPKELVRVTDFSYNNEVCQYLQKYNLLN